MSLKNYFKIFFLSLYMQRGIFEYNNAQNKKNSKTHFIQDIGMMIYSKSECTDKLLFPI